MVTTNQPTDQPGEPSASLLVEHWAKQTFAILVHPNVHLEFFDRPTQKMKHMFHMIILCCTFHKTQKDDDDDDDGGGDGDIIWQEKAYFKKYIIRDV